MDHTSTWQAIEHQPLSTPAEGVALNADEFGYVKRKSADTQAEFWNAILKEHPTLSPTACGYKIGVSEEKYHGYYPLVWVAEKQ